MRRRVFNQRGIALVIVMWMLVMLAAFASELALNARGDVGAARNFAEDRQAYFIARAGVEMALNEIMEDGDYHYLIEGQLVFGRNGDDLRPPALVSRTRTAFGGGLLTYSITDENAKLNLNALARNEAQLRELFKNLGGIDDQDTVVDSILDWVDDDDYHRANGAESDYYQSLPEPYKAKNTDFDTLEELKKVRGVTPEIFRVLAPVLTVYPYGKVNPNTASEPVLLTQGIPPDQVAAMMKDRQQKGFTDPLAKSDTFTILSSGQFEGSRLMHTVRAVARKGTGKRIQILDWTDDYYMPPPSPVLSAAK